MIEDLVHFYKSNKGTLKTNTEVFDFKELLKDICKLQSDLLKRESVSFNIRFSYSLNQCINYVNVSYSKSFIEDKKICIFLQLT